VSARGRDRASLLADADYFAGELIRRLDGLQRCEPVPPLRRSWRTASQLTGRIRRELQAARVRDRERRRRETRLQESQR
jgi:hypothetical protein